MLPLGIVAIVSLCLMILQLIGVAAGMFQQNKQLALLDRKLHELLIARVHKAAEAVSRSSPQRSHVSISLPGAEEPPESHLRRSIPSRQGASSNEQYQQQKSNSRAFLSVISISSAHGPYAVGLADQQKFQ